MIEPRLTPSKYGYRHLAFSSEPGEVGT
jgi:hypothetical protein